MADAFDRLGLKENASDQDIRHAYRRFVQKMHPDRIGNTPENQRKFCQLQDDYALLKDPARRQRLIDQRRQPFTPPPQPPPSASPPPSPAASFQWSWVNTPVTAAHVPPSDLHVDLPIPLSLAWSGGTCTLIALAALPCGCNRSPRCGRCQGTGQVFVRQAIAITIPAGTLDKQVLRAKGQGHRGTQSSGDLYAKVQWTDRHGWCWKKDVLSKEIVLPSPMYRPFKKVWMHAPSGNLGHFKCPEHMDHHLTPVNLPGLGFLDASGRRQAVTVLIRKGSWWLWFPIWWSQMVLGWKAWRINKKIS